MQQMMLIVFILRGKDLYLASTGYYCKTYLIVFIYGIDTNQTARDSQRPLHRDDYECVTHVLSRYVVCVFFPDMESHSIPASYRPQLHLIGLTFKDEGQYFCVARNSLGTDRSQPMLLNITCRFLMTKQQQSRL